jgi:hypothetical protein
MHALVRFIYAHANFVGEDNMNACMYDSCLCFFVVEKIQKKGKKKKLVALILSGLDARAGEIEAGDFNSGHARAYLRVLDASLGGCDVL